MVYFTSAEFFSITWSKKDHGRKIFFLPLISLAGLLAGYLIHPQFPNTFIIWKVQSLDALLNPVLGSGKALTPKLIPMEMLPGNFAWYRNMLPFYFLCYCGIFFFVRLKEKKERRFLSSLFLFEIQKRL